MTTYMITGANRGIGLELTRQALASGHRVIATCRHPDRASELSALEGTLDIHTLDITQHKATEELANKLKSIEFDVLINNAGYMAENQSVADMDYEQWITSFKVNTMAPWQLSLAFANHLRAAPNPRLITLTSQMASLHRAGSDRVAYRSSKAAANMAMRTLALEWQSEGITVCMLHPGWVRTDMGGQSATLSTIESASGLHNVIDSLTMENTGQFLDYKGQEIPW